MDSAQMVDEGTILRATVGSTVHGLHHGGQDDRDEMAVYIEPPAYLIGLARARGIRGGLYGFEHYVERTQPEGVRSGPGDLDLVAYSLRKYVRLALKGHPTILLLLFVPRRADRRQDRTWATSSAASAVRFSRARPAGATSATCAGRRSGCSARVVRRTSTGPSSSRHTATTRSTPCTQPGSESRASSCSRPGGVTLPMPEPDRSRVMAIRTGERSFEEAIAEIDDLERAAGRRAGAHRPAATSPTVAPSMRSSSRRTGVPGAGRPRSLPALLLDSHPSSPP